jgi:hypothetical protein
MPARRPQRGARHGVASYTTKPADLATLAQVFAEVTAEVARPLRVLLLIENDLEKRTAITTALAGPDREFQAFGYQVHTTGIVLEIEVRPPVVVVGDHAAKAYRMSSRGLGGSEPPDIGHMVQ